MEENHFFTHKTENGQKNFTSRFALKNNNENRCYTEYGPVHGNKKLKKFGFPTINLFKFHLESHGYLSLFQSYLK